MKIDAYTEIARLYRIDSVRAPQKAAPVTSVADDQISLSSDARFLNELRQATEEIPEVRMDVVEQTRAELAAGTIGTEQDLERAIDALLMEL